MRTKEKIKEIENYISELTGFLPDSFEEYIRDAKTKAACERYFERIIGSVIDLAFLVIKEKSLKTPEEDKEAFDILASEGIISDSLAGRLKDAKGMRNIIAHQYGSIDDETVFTSITEELIRDAKEFIRSIKITLKK